MVPTRPALGHKSGRDSGRDFFVSRFFLKQKEMSVVYFDQRFGAAHFKHCVFNIFHAKNLKKQENTRKLRQNLAKNVFIKFDWSRAAFGPFYNSSNCLSCCTKRPLLF